MTIKTLDKKTRELKKEVGLLRSFVIGQAGRDPEGEYNPAFARRVLKVAQEKPLYEFKDAKSFLRHIQNR